MKAYDFHEGLAFFFAGVDEKKEEIRHASKTEWNTCENVLVASQNVENCEGDRGNPAEQLLPQVSHDIQKHLFR